MTQQIKALLAENEIYIYGDIGEQDVAAKPFIDQLKAMDTSRTVHVRINSRGGDVGQALAIYNALTELKDVVCHIDGMAASAASFIAMAGKTVMAENAMFMIHLPRGSTYGTAEDLRKHGDLLDKITPSMSSAYLKKTGMPEARLNEMLAGETWFTASEALEIGFIDEIASPMAMVAQTDLSIFNQVPEKIAEIHSQARANVQEIENMLDLFKGERVAENVTAQSLMAQGKTTPDAVRAHLMTELGKHHKPSSGAIPMNENDHLKNFMADASDAILMRKGIPVKNASDGARELANLSLIQMADRHLNLTGKSTMLMSKQQILAEAFTHSTGDFQKLLGNTAEKALRGAYEESNESHMIWTGEREVPDFKPQSLVQLSEAPDLDKVAEGAEYKHGSFSDDGMVFQVEKYGKIFTMTYEAMINDDLDAFSRLPRSFGIAARRKECDLVYSTLTSNPKLSDGKALFHADHKNIATSTGLTASALGNVRAMMRKQRGLSSSAPLNLQPAFLIVPAVYESQAEQLIASTVDPSKSNDTPNSQFIRNLTLVVDSRLDEVSETDWYVAASPSQVDTITRAYLAGAGRPHYETREGWEIDGLSVKCRLEFASVPVDYRGLVKVGQA
ncbi:head maturation protease, ClpP-related [Marinobacter sp. UBA2688]|uniref:head maturation protease, ClpP-related n=1 Tax=Marinobacter sp. UBA2688 TaxID=1946816 RepID=UPI00257D0AE6|nr:head maturation protease, ClpP-related [Marinobacter sp. UBA2688]|tara:strand:+ start:1295 stop:3148 length:1854 start_codon:yes stop_codon:yes gene_type:complete